jgi:hypothetical protein
MFLALIIGGLVGAAAVVLVHQWWTQAFEESERRPLVTPSMRVVAREGTLPFVTRSRRGGRAA